MIFEKLTINDLSEVLLIEEAAHIIPWTEEVFQQCFRAGYQAVGVKIGDKFIGFAVYSLAAGECHLLNICIHPTFQGQGTGQALLQYVLEKIKEKGAEVIFLEVRSSNLRARYIYDKLGFIKIGERKAYYDSPSGREDAWVFAKDLGVA